ncbi:GNAT family N-acetyltransferase [Silvimonas amylolytica]|uniref:N-acetyltransferase n=1 Tax=Silvimonas amylolytica TaxID=449663 RepID=A0ABQ2PQL9_9NEIS|nr:GNAT family N-acetyltransferase [Silvimonas amylolytica]GGP27588.1 N-acetyltransferase [Silvimonas amylolytica]
MTLADTLTDTITIRPATPDDAQTLAALAITVWLNTYAIVGIRPALANYVFSTYTQDHFERLMHDARYALLVACQGEHLVGYAALDFDAAQPAVPHTDIELHTLYVLPRFTGQGIGKSLLNACETRATERAGHCALWLSVNSQNHAALAFYNSRQFEQYGTLFFELDSVRYENRILASA